MLRCCYGDLRWKFGSVAKLCTPKCHGKCQFCLNTMGIWAQNFERRQFHGISVQCFLNSNLVHIGGARWSFGCDSLRGWRGQGAVKVTGPFFGFIINLAASYSTYYSTCCRVVWILARPKSTMRSHGEGSVSDCWNPGKMDMWNEISCVTLVYI